MTDKPGSLGTSFPGLGRIEPDKVVKVKTMRPTHASVDSTWSQSPYDHKVAQMSGLHLGATNCHYRSFDGQIGKKVADLRNT